MFLEPSDSSYIDKMEFEYQLEHYDNSELSLNLFFENPAYISKARQPEIFVIRLKDTTIFRSKEGEPIYENVEVRSSIRPQIGHSSVATALKGVALLTTALIAASFSISVILKFSAD